MFLVLLVVCVFSLTVMTDLLIGFTSMFPVSIDLNSSDLSNLDACLKMVKEQLRKIPKRGVGYGLLKYFGGAKYEELKYSISAQSEGLEQVYFNFLGKFDSLFKRAELCIPNSTNPVLVNTSEGADTFATALIEMNAIIGSDNCLECEWKFVTGLFEDSEIEKLSSRFLEVLSTFASFVGENSQNFGGFTPSDFPLVPNLTQAGLDKLIGDNKNQVLDIYPLTPLQEGMLFHTLKEPHDELYITQIVWPMTIPNLAMFKKVR